MTNHLHPIWALGRKLQMAALDVGRNIQFPGCPKSVTFDALLCALFARCPDEIGKFFQNPGHLPDFVRTLYPQGIKEPPNLLSDLIRRLYPEGIKDPADLRPEKLLPLMKSSGLGEGLGMPPSFEVPIDKVLTEILASALSLARSEGRDRIEISDLIGGLSSDAELVAKFQRESGLLLKELPDRAP